MRRSEPEVAVIGVGSLGSMALWTLARRGVPAIGFEQFEPGHDQGSGTGESRIIRSCYAEGAHYVALLRRSFELWAEFEADTGTHVLTRCPVVYIAPPGNPYLRSVIEVADRFDLPHEILRGPEAAARLERHVLDPEDVVFVDPEGGALRPELAGRTAAARARELGAEVVSGVRVEAVEEDADGVTIRTSAGEHRASRAVVCAGAWVGRVLPGVVPHWVERQVQYWFRAEHPEDFAPDRTPVFIRKRAGLDVYGFPTLDGETVKIALHHGGTEADPDRLDRETSPADGERVSAFARDLIRGLDPRPVRAKVCMYTNSPDGDFVIGAVPGSTRLTVLGGMSGHGFKFATVMGEIAADLAMEGGTGHPIQPFRPDRFDGGSEGPDPS